LVANFFLVIFLYVATEPLGVPAVPTPTIQNGVLVKTNVVVRRENFTWEQLESTNYGTFITNLAAVGCPPQTIRDIVVSEINRLYERRRLDEVDYPNYQWWRARPEPAAAQAAAAKLEALEAERKQLLTDLLGPGWDAEDNEMIAANGGITLTGPLLGDLPAEVKAAVYAIAADGVQKLETYEEAQRGQGKPVDPMEIVRLREEPLRELVTVLNPPSYEEYLLRYSPGGDQLRAQMRTMQLSPDQFRDLFNAVYPINSQPVFYYNGDDPSLLSQQHQLHTQTDAILKTSLGDDLYAVYQLSQDPLYQTSQATAEQLGVSQSSVMSIYEINRATQAELDRIRGDTNMTSDEKVEALSQAQVEEQQSLEQILGPDAFAKWLQTHAGLH
jgi:hypothetical protein